MESYSPQERRVMETALREGRALECPRCACPLDRRPVPRPAAVAYVRHRSLVTCPRCGRHAALDRD